VVEGRVNPSGRLLQRNAGDAGVLHSGSAPRIHSAAVQREVLHSAPALIDPVKES